MGGAGRVLAFLGADSVDSAIASATGNQRAAPAVTTIDELETSVPAVKALVFAGPAETTDIARGE